MKKYTIREVSHYIGFRFHPILNPVRVDFEFTNESKYELKPRTLLREQCNKLGRLGFNITGTESSRIGWRYNSDTDLFEVCKYLYINGNIATITTNKESVVSLDKFQN